MHTQRYGFWGYLILIIGLAGICALLIIINQDVLIKSGVSARLIWGIWAGLFSLFLLGVVCSPFWWIRKQRKAQFIYRPKNSAENDQPVSSPSEDILTDLSSNIRLRYGPFWRRKVRLLLVTGEPEEAEAIAPGLTGQHWLEGDHTVLIYGGRPTAEPDVTLLTALKKLRRSRPLDGIIWPLTEEQSRQTAQLDKGWRELINGGKRLGFQAPLYLWQVCDDGDYQTGRPLQSVGCLLPERCTPEQLAVMLEAQTLPLTEQGMSQLLADNRHDFLLRLAHTLAERGIAHWQSVLKPLLAGGAFSSLRLRGLMFSPPLAAVPEAAPHAWLPSPVWAGVTGDNARGRTVGFPWLRTALMSAVCVLVIWGAGMTTSFFANRALVQETGIQTARALDTRLPLAEQLVALHTLQGELERLQYRIREGAPWYQRFGLERNQQLLAAAFPGYAQAANRLVRDVAVDHLQQQLNAFVALPPNSPQRTATGEQRYKQLKALLMTSRPEKADAAFFSTTLMADGLRYENIPEGVRQSVLPSLLTFWTANLPEHPQWKTSPPPELTGAVRKILLRQIGVRNAENTLYQNVLQQVSRNYADMTLADMTGDTLTESLFSTEQTVPGMFTRQAWEGQVREAIEQVVTARREEIDWVLSDRQQDTSADISPDTLRNRLTSRYFTDFAGSWLAFLNSIRWKKEDSLSGILDQLTLMADARQSPLIALTDTLAWQAAAGRENRGLSDSLAKSAQELFNGKEKTPQQSREGNEPVGPLDKTFAPLLRLLGDKAGGGGGDTQLSLQTYLTRVTRVRLKLQQVTNAPDPQEMTQQLAQTVLQGKTVDLTDTRDYGRLIAASLGEEWSGFGQALFVRPVEQSWRQVLTPAADSLNRQWQRAIVSHWNQDFAGRYPFKASQNDASLPLLAQYLRDDGRINQFIAANLSGVLKREGRYWVADAMNTQGLTVNPDFIRALNRLRDVADTAFASGDAGIHFELRAKPARDVMKTHLVIDGQELEYFNQKERWQRFNWPDEQWQPGASLSWTSTQAMERILADYRGSWSLIRLLEQAQVTPVDSSTFKVVWKAQDGLPLNYLLRVEQGKGPLAPQGAETTITPPELPRREMNQPKKSEESPQPVFATRSVQQNDKDASPPVPSPEISRQRTWPIFMAGMVVMAGLGGTGLWGWSQLNQPDALIQRIQLSVMPLPQSLESGELAKLDVKDKALLAQDRTIAASQMQLEQLNKLPARWPLEQGYRQLRQLDALWPDNPQVRALNAQWRKQRELSALSAEALNGYAQAQSQLQRLSAQLDALDERKGRYLTGSELKTAVYGIRQSLKEPPLEELLRQLEEQKQTGEVSPTLLTQIDTRLNQLLNRYVILLDTKVEQSQ
ncbi:TPA: type VI secretion protein VasK [Escherichia coli]|nr:type VI secretion protein VasK [Escherichia coli]